MHGNVAGVAIVPVPEPMPAYQLEMLHSHKIPVVFCHRRTTEAKSPLVTWSFEDVGRSAAERLTDLGHRRIACINGPRTATNEGYERGLRKVLQERNVPFFGDCDSHDAPFLVGSAAEIEERMEVVVERLLDTTERPTGVFCGDDFHAERLYLAALRRGLRVPGDLSIISFGPAWRDGPVRKKLTAVTVDEIELGRRAVRMLDEMRTGHRPLSSDEVVTLPLLLAEGQSLGPPKDNSW
jgi:DNA-binding LacI/PurR family transcriptional regulator